MTIRWSHSGVGTACRPMTRKSDEGDHVAHAIERDAAERAAARHRRLATEPAGADQLADADRQDVVAREPAEHHLVEPPQPELGGIRDPPPARGLEQIPEHERHDREQDEPDVRVAESRANRVRIGVSDREPEEDRADREAAEGDDHPAARHLHVQLEAVVRELEQVGRG